MYIPYSEKEKIRIVFMVQVASFWPSIESFYRECKEDDSFDVKIFFIDESSVEKVQMEKTKEFLLKKKLPFEIYSEEKMIEFYPHIAVYQPPYDVSYRNPSALSLHMKKMGVRIIYVPYGIEISDTEDARLAHFDTFVVRNSWRIYTISQMMKDEYMKYCSNRHAVRVTGLPKFDSFQEKLLPLNSAVSKVAAGRRIVLWKMHFPKLIYDNKRKLQVTPYLEEYEQFEERISKYEEKLFFIVMPHPMFYSETISMELGKQARGLIKKLETHPNVYVDRDPDYRNSLRNAEAIIIDRSAIMVEAAMCKVPILYMSNPDYQEPLTLPIKKLIDTYEQGQSSNDICNFLDDFVAGKMVVKKQQKRVTEEVIPYIYGDCGMRIKEDILKSMKEGEYPKIRLVLFGTGQVCTHYIKELKLMQDTRFEIVAFSDNSKEKWGQQINGVEVVEPRRLQEIEFDMVVITTEQYHMQIKKQLVYDLFLGDEKIVRLDYFCEYLQDWRKYEGSLF